MRFSTLTSISPSRTPHELAEFINPLFPNAPIHSLAVGYIRQPQQDAALAAGLSAYLVYQEGSGSSAASGGAQFGQALVNALVIVGVIAAATFVLVLCYYFRCLKLMVGYLVFASVNLLGYSGGFMAVSAIQLAALPVDWLTLSFLMFNFAIGGAVAVFWQRGIPRIITQAYLIAVSVIMSWLVTKLPEWTSWALLVMLALYDLCAVLTPCGPLRALIALAQTRRDPIPGLLYEANVGSGGNADGVRDTFASGTGTRPSPTPSVTAAATAAQSAQLRSQPPGLDAAAVPWPTSSGASVRANTVTAPFPGPVGGGGGEAGLSMRRLQSASSPTPTMVDMPAGRGDISRGSSNGHMTAVPNAMREAGLPTDSGKASAAAAGGGAGEPSAMDAVAAQNTAVGANEDAMEEEDADDDGGERSIKLGLGDFVFYSVLVSRAALYDTSTFAACFVSVLMGLGGTLFLLGLFKKALPALPISIFLGVAAYFMTRLVVTPLIVELTLHAVGI